MKKYALLIVAVMLMVSMLSCQGPGANDRYVLPHVGKWIGVDASGMRAMVVFRENGTGTIEFQNTISQFNYVIDYSRNPLWLDLVYSREGKPFRTKLIARFLDENRLSWYTFFDERRPAAFPAGADAGNVMTLTRLSAPTKI